MIVGGGVVGCYLGSKIQDKEIWEAKNQMHEKTCSALFSRNIAKFGIPVEESCLNEVYGARFFSDNESFEVRQRTVQAHVCDRLEFQRSVEKMATDNGCKITYGKRWNDEQDDYIMGCDGAISGVMKSMNMTRKFIYTYQVEAQLKSDPDFVQLHFGGFAPGFFAWIIPMNENEAKIGLGIQQGTGNPKARFDEVVAKRNINLSGGSKIQSALIPVYDKKPVTLDNKALCGDEAAQVKNTTGGGILFGCAAADILKEAVDKQDLTYYETRHRKELIPKLNDHDLVSKILQRADYDRLFKAVRERHVDELISEHGDMENLSGLKKQFFKRPLTMLAMARAMI